MKPAIPVRAFADEIARLTRRAARREFDLDEAIGRADDELGSLASKHNILESENLTLKQTVKRQSMAIEAMCAKSCDDTILQNRLEQSEKIAAEAISERNRLSLALAEAERRCTMHRDSSAKALAQVRDLERDLALARGVQNGAS
jgi:chromosome segregation ATPase